MRKVDVLYELQELDSALDRARESLEQYRAGLGDDSELVPLREAVEAARAELHTLQQKGRDLDWDLELATGKMKVEEKKLYGGTVKNPKELSSLAHEVENEKERISRLEDQALMNMDALEEASAARQAAERTFAEQEQAWKSAQAALEAECASLTGQVEALSGRRLEIVARADPSTLRVYESLRRTRAGTAVALVVQRACQGCRINLSSSEVQRARSSADPVFCQSCGRILYIPG